MPMIGQWIQGWGWTNTLIKAQFIFHEEFKNHMTPLSLPNFITYPHLFYSGHFYWMTRPTKKKKTLFQGFKFFYIFYYFSTSRYSAHYEDNIYNPLVYYREKFFTKTNGSPGACCVWPIIVIFLI